MYIDLIDALSIKLAIQTIFTGLKHLIWCFRHWFSVQTSWRRYLDILCPN